ncbi:MAG: 16S rRNA (uracil(1498)-N(3))-methyltransferase [Coriobacteriia bacterium]|nr:16S rRNA (uracil(1498)-N(3))-methyltransferase [Coriobacteriia bacterium]
MTLPRFFITLPSDQQPCAPGSTLLLSRTGDFDAQVYHHLVTVLRLKSGEQIQIVQRDSWQGWLCQIETIDATQLTLRVITKLEAASDPFELTLVIGCSKGDTTEQVVRQASELGVARIMPVLFDRCVSRPRGTRAEGKIARLQKVAQSAAQQSQRCDLPIVTQLYSFSAAAEQLVQLQPDALFILWEEEEEPSSTLTEMLAKLPLPDPAVRRPHIVLVVGPEGGITYSEVAALRELGGSSVSLGRSILRVDTAACAAVAITAAALRSRLDAAPVAQAQKH